MKKTIKNITILRPGGNNTALVPGINRSPEEKKVINDAIMKKYKNVEQVGFLYLSKPELEMAGGEFCGNATRSTAYLALNGKPGEVLIKVSGVNRLLKAGVSRKNTAWAEMPIYSSSSKITFVADLTIVEMQGITQVVKAVTKRATPKNRKKEALKILSFLGLLRSVPASGVMFVRKYRQKIIMEPVVYVRDIDTLFYETACASGSTAVGLVEAFKNKNSVRNLPIKQPSEMDLYVTVEFKNNKFTFAKIDGPIKILRKNITMSFPRKRESLEINKFVPDEINFV